MDQNLHSPSTPARLANRLAEALSTISHEGVLLEWNPRLSVVGDLRYESVLRRNENNETAFAVTVHDYSSGSILYCTLERSDVVRVPAMELVKSSNRKIKFEAPANADTLSLAIRVVQAIDACPKGV
jgi:hypothetical protein